MLYKKRLNKIYEEYGVSSDDIIQIDKAIIVCNENINCDINVIGCYHNKFIEELNELGVIKEHKDNRKLNSYYDVPTTNHILLSILRIIGRNTLGKEIDDSTQLKLYEINNRIDDLQLNLLSPGKRKKLYIDSQQENEKTLYFIKENKKDLKALMYAKRKLEKKGI